MASYSGNTRAGLAIRAGRKIKRICGIPTIEVDPPKIFAEGRCCEVPYATEFISSAGASVHVWLENTADVKKLEKLVDALIYWKDVAVLTWALGEPPGFKTNYRLHESNAALRAATEQTQAGAGKRKIAFQGAVPAARL